MFSTYAPHSFTVTGNHLLRGGFYPQFSVQFPDLTHQVDIILYQRHSGTHRAVGWIIWRKSGFHFFLLSFSATALKLSLMNVVLLREECCRFFIQEKWLSKFFRSFFCNCFCQSICIFYCHTTNWDKWNNVTIPIRRDAVLTRFFCHIN